MGNRGKNDAEANHIASELLDKESEEAESRKRKPNEEGSEREEHS